MAVNEITLQKAAQIQRLDPTNTKFFMKNGFLAMTYTDENGEKTHDRVFLHRESVRIGHWESDNRKMEV